MVSQYSVISDPFTAPSKPATNKQASHKQDASASGFETHLRNQDRREPAQRRDDRQAVDRDTRPKERPAAHSETRRVDSDDKGTKASASVDQANDKRDTRQSAEGTRSSDRAERQDQTNTPSEASAKPEEAKPAARPEGQSKPAASAKAETPIENEASAKTETGETEAAPIEPGKSDSKAESTSSALMLMAQALGAQPNSDANAEGEAESEPVTAAGSDKLASALADTGMDQGTKDAKGNQVNNDGQPQAQTGSQTIAQTQDQAQAAVSLVADQQQEGAGDPAQAAVKPGAKTASAQPAAEMLDTDADKLIETAIKGTGEATGQQQTGETVTNVAGQPQGEQTNDTGEVNVEGRPANPITEQQTAATPSDGSTTQNVQVSAPVDGVDPVTQSVSSHQTEPVVQEESDPVIAQTKQPQQESQETSDLTTSTANQQSDLPDDQQGGQKISQDLTQQQAPNHNMAQNLTDQTAQSKDAAASDTPDQIGQNANSTNGTKQTTTPDQQQSQTAAALSALSQGKKGTEQATNDQQQTDKPSDAASSDTSDAGDEPTRAKTVNPLTIAAANEAGSTFRKAPKADAFTKMMAGIDKQGALKDLARQSDPALKVDGMPPMQGDGSTVRLTGMESFARTGHAPQQAAAANAQAMAAQISKFAQRGETRFQIRLDPADLGKVDVRLTIGSDGQTRAHLFVERPETLDMFMRDQRMMERSLLQSGINLDKQGLDFSLMDQQNGGQQMAQDQHETMEQDHAGSSSKSQSAAEETPNPAIIHPTHSGTYVASNGVNLVI
nr:flagellar hook-length control protein FliK [uncultured Cohaesibacter sp.]